MSSQFWVQLTLALFVLCSGVVFIHQYRRGAFRTLRAKLLRRRLLYKLKTLLPTLANELHEDNPDLFPIFRLRADLEATMRKSHLLFSDERTLVADFLASLSASLAKHDANQLTRDDLEEVVLQGQRAVLELTEIGF